MVVGAAFLGRWAWFALMALIAACSAYELRRLDMRGIWWVILFVLLSAVLLGLLYEGHGMWPTLWYIFIIWANDVGAYLVGTTLGRHKLCPRVSPLKTWEGAFGGLVAGAAPGFAGASVMGWDVWFWAVLSVVAVITGVAGDLAESMLKRKAGVKDSGKLLPGHGGILDRFDALLFSAPFVLLYFTLLG